MSDEQYEIGFRGRDEGFGAAARAAVGEIGKIRTAINAIPQNAISSLGAKFAAVFSADFLVQKTNEMIKFGSSVNDMAQRIGVSTDFMQKLRYAFEKTGSSAQWAAGALREMQRSQVIALGSPQGPDAQAFRHLGISLQDLRGMSGEELFMKVADAIERGSGNATELTSAMTILGRYGGEALTTLREGFRGLADEAVEVGSVIESDIIEQLDDTGDRIDAMVARTRTGFASIVSGLINVWEKGANFTEKLVQSAFAAFDARKDPEFYKKLGGSKGAIQNAVDEIDKMQANEGNEAARRRAERRARGGSGGVEPLREVGEPTGQSVQARIQSDALQRIGLFIGGSTTLIDVQRRQLDVATQTLDLTRRMAQTMDTSWR